MIRDRIVFGTNSPKVREKLISKGSALTLDKAVELARSFEASQAQLSVMAGSSTNNSEETVHLVQKQNTGKGPQGTQPSNSQPPRGTRLCGNCGRSHNSLSNCPARGQTCLYWKKHAMLNRCIDTGLKLNPDKCFVKQEKIKFYGVICRQDGVQPDPGKVSALKQMSSATNRQELQTFLGLGNYMGPFIIIIIIIIFVYFHHSQISLNYR